MGSIERVEGAAGAIEAAGGHVSAASKRLAAAYANGDISHEEFLRGIRETALRANELPA